MMRIITGKNKGKLLRMPRGIRPTQNKVRKALFDILGDIGGLSFLELFAGSGAVGLEAASRGAGELALVEDEPGCISAIDRNIKSLNFKSCRLYPVPALDAVKEFSRRKKEFDIIFLDPPYYRGLAKKTLQILDAYDILAPNGIIIVQHFRKDILPHDLRRLALTRQKRYGDTELSFLVKRG
ncbi:MAG: 16S rRNA (guanine(966)-N(2))-methyltransferase RsmD [Candidatus Omnitrophota bacterium]